MCAPAWKKGLKSILNKGNLYVYHDAGLDPYVMITLLKILNAPKSMPSHVMQTRSKTKKGGRRSTTRNTKHRKNRKREQIKTKER